MKEKWIKMIENTIYNHQNYYKGIDIFKEEKVDKVEFDHQDDELIVYANVIGNYENNYLVPLRINDQEIINYCSCPDNSKNYSSFYLCKHAIAVLIYTLEYLNQGFILKKVKEEDLFNIINNYEEAFVKDGQSLKLKVEYEFKINDKDNFEGVYIGLRMGIDKLYVVKNLSDFLLTYKGINENCNLTKELDYKEKDYEFNLEDKKVFDLMFEFLHYQDKNSGSSQKRFLFIPFTKLKEIYLLTKELPVKYNLGTSKIIIGNPNIKIELIEEEEKIQLKISDMSLLRGYNHQSGFLFYDDNLYLPDNNFCNLILPLLHLNIEKGKIFIPLKYKELLIEKMLPYLIFNEEKLIDLNKPIFQDISFSELQTKLYIDKEGKSAVLNLEFIYSNNDSKKFVVKDIKTEGKIKNIIFQVNPILKNNKYYLSNMEAIFRFTEEVIPLLQKEGVLIYYSASFKNMLQKRSFNYSTSVAFENDLLAVNFNYDDLDISELSNILKNIKENKKYYQLKNGNIIKIDNKEALEWSNIVDKLEVSENVLNSNKYLFNKYESLYLDNIFTNLDEEKINYDLEFQYLVDNVKNFNKLNFKFPTNINATLRDYQIKGYKWLKTLKYFGFGGILADDMGLGKTLQVITLIQDLKEEQGKTKSLVVAPSSVIYNWEAELKKFAPDLKYIILAESKLIREEHFTNLDNYDVIVTSYALIRRDIEKYQDYRFDFCFLDEAQYIKNLFSSSANACKQIKAETKFAMTGTPIENSISELWSIFDFIMPGYLKTYNHFRKNYEKPIINFQNEEVLNKLFNKVKPFILRREKKEVILELPEKQERNVYISLEEEQEKVYLAHFLQAKKEISEELNINGFNKSQIKILSILTRLRQICCHPNLFIENYQGNSAKLKHLIKLIEEKIANGNRILLFSQFTSMLDIIEGVLEKNSYFRIDGKVKALERMEMVNRFNMGEKEIFLISLKAGGTGLNLVGADTVIHFDPWWNPAVEDQATDRAYRIGQENKVEVYKLITKNTIEEKINELKDRKREVANSLIKSGETFINKLSEDELVNILSE